MFQNQGRFQVWGRPYWPSTPPWTIICYCGPQVTSATESKKIQNVQDADYDLQSPSQLWIHIFGRTVSFHSSPNTYDNQQESVSYSLHLRVVYQALTRAWPFSFVALWNGVPKEVRRESCLDMPRRCCKGCWFPRQLRKAELQASLKERRGKRSGVCSFILVLTENVF